MMRYMLRVTWDAFLAVLLLPVALIMALYIKIFYEWRGKNAGS